MGIKIVFLSGLGARLDGPGGQARHSEWQVDVAEGETVRDLLTRLGVENDKFRHFVFDPGTLTLAEGIIIVLNGRLLDLVGGLAARLNHGDQLEIVPGFAGG